jgi:hypothetical protein
MEGDVAGPPGVGREIVVGSSPNGYEILAELGRGGMGVVYQARQTALRRIVALKMILGGGHASAGDLQRFGTEAESIARLQHPHIVQIHEVGEHGGLPYFSLEFCGGGSLEKRLAGTPLAPLQAAGVVEKLAQAMQAAHDKGVIHRDLKPANVLLAEDGTPKITDFGLAKKLDEAGKTQAGSVMGTPSYMAPEQACGSIDIGPATDIYALGAILYEMLTGRPPFRASTPVDTILQVIHEEPAGPRQLQSKVPRDLETICLKCLQKEPHKRYASAAALADDLARFRSDRPILARPVGRVERTWRWCRRNPVVAGLLGLVAVCIVAAAVLLYQERSETLHNLARAEGAEKDLTAQLKLTEAAERAKTEKLWQSYLDQARAGRVSGRMGQRFDSLAALKKAAEIRPDSQLRDEMIACLALADLRPGKSYPIWLTGTKALVFDHSYERYVRVDEQGNMTVRKLADDREIFQVRSAGSMVDIKLSPDGAFLAATHGIKGGDWVRVWAVETGRELVTQPITGGAWVFSPDSRSFAAQSDRLEVHQGNHTLAGGRTCPDACLSSARQTARAVLSRYGDVRRTHLRRGGETRGCRGAW